MDEAEEAERAEAGVARGGRGRGGGRGEEAEVGADGREALRRPRAVPVVQQFRDPRGRLPWGQVWVILIGGKSAGIRALGGGIGRRGSL